MNFDDVEENGECNVTLLPKVETEKNVDNSGEKHFTDGRLRRSVVIKLREAKFNREIVMKHILQKTAEENNI